MTDIEKIESDYRSANLQRAFKDLEQAELHLAQARADEAAAEHEIEDAIDGIKEAEQRDVVVHVVHVNEAERVSFKERLDVTLQRVWDKSYEELKITRQAKDVFQQAANIPDLS